VEKETRFMGKCIFIVDDDIKICEIIKKYLVKELFEVEIFTSPIQALKKVTFSKPDMFVLDITMPEMDGFELYKEIRKISDVPVIFASAKGEELDKLIGLEIGGDDYLAKPYSPRELVARVKVIFRRISANITSTTKIDKDKIYIGNLCIDINSRKVICNNTEILLTLKEFDVLRYFASTPDKAYGRNEIILDLWGFEGQANDRIVDDLIKRLRKKLNEKESTFTIQTVWGFGYKGNVVT
jgi:two-component system response regulator CssR